MQTQNIFIAHPANAEQVTALKAVLKALKIKFETTTAEAPYNQGFVDNILQGGRRF